VRVLQREIVMGVLRFNKKTALFSAV